MDCDGDHLSLGGRDDVNDEGGNARGMGEIQECRILCAMLMFGCMLRCTRMAVSAERLDNTEVNGS